VLVRGKRLLSNWLDRLAPRQCALCGATLAPGAFPGFCAGCLYSLPGADAVRCPVCALPAAPDERRCTGCSADPPPFDATLAAADYAPPLDRAVTAMKFGRQIALARPLGELLAIRWLGRVPGAGADALQLDCLVPVPLAPARLARRGFNQALEMARVCSAALAGRRGQALPVRTALRRLRETPAQASLDLAERGRNLAGCFGCAGRLDGLAVGLVDDVMTSGHTLAEAARALRRAGASSVVNLVVARTR
jgi:predicted amidophosphoribosyltransferase